MRSRRAGAALLALALALGAGCSSSKHRSTPTTTVPPTVPTTQAAQFQKAVDHTRDKLGFPGAIAGVWTPTGEWTGVSGVAREGGGKPPTLETHTRIGSVTKTFTVTLILQLAEDGKLSLDDTIEKYVPGMPNGTTATLRQLADMTSGIPNYASEEPFQRLYLTAPQSKFTPEQLIFFVRGQPPDFPAGNKFALSNTNTVLLGMVVEKVTGQPFAVVLRDRILKPLGLAQTSFPGQSAALPDPHWLGITEQGQADGDTIDATNWNPSWSFAAGEMISTLKDLHTWAVALGTGQGILKPETQATRAASVDPKSRVYGLGIRLVDGWVGQAGEIPGFSTVVNYNANTKTTIVVLVNSDVATSGVNPAAAVFAALAHATADKSVLADNGDQTVTEPQT